jgi:hypothetical protein
LNLQGLKLPRFRATYSGQDPGKSLVLNVGSAHRP